MKALVITAALTAALLSLPSARPEALGEGRPQQERPVPKDSTRLSTAGCAHGRVFTVGRDPEHEALGFRLEEGMKIRLEGQKAVLEEVKKHEGSMVEITGLMKQTDTVQPGVGLAGGKVRVTPVMPSGRGPSAGPAGMPTPVMDVESWRLLNSSCPKR
jgi:hypothetical protein